jgi:Protein of unknown function (DUF2917)
MRCTVNQFNMSFLQQYEAPATGLFKLSAGRALTVRARQPSDLRAGPGGLWLTSSHCPGDHFLAPGQRWRAQAGEVLVMEPWQLGADGAARFAWDVLPAPAASQARPAEWRVALHELRHAGALLARAGLHLLRALGAAGLRGLAGVATVFVASRAVFAPARGRFGLDDLAQAATPACKAN